MIKRAGHFRKDDAADGLPEVATEFIRANPSIDLIACVGQVGRVLSSAGSKPCTGRTA
jgi:hypothetical protein